MRTLNQYRWYRKWRGGIWYLLKTYPKSCEHNDMECPAYCCSYYWARGIWKENLDQFKGRFISDSVQTEDYTTMSIVNPNSEILYRAKSDKYTIIINDEGQIEIRW